MFQRLPETHTAWTLCLTRVSPGDVDWNPGAAEPASQGWADGGTRQHRPNMSALSGPRVWAARRQQRALLTPSVPWASSHLSSQLGTQPRRASQAISPLLIHHTAQSTITPAPLCCWLHHTTRPTTSPGPSRCPVYHVAWSTMWPGPPRRLVSHATGSTTTPAPLRRQVRHTAPPALPAPPAPPAPPVSCPTCSGWALAVLMWALTKTVLDSAVYVLRCEAGFSTPGPSSWGSVLFPNLAGAPCTCAW